MRGGGGTHTSVRRPSSSTAPVIKNTTLAPNPTNTTKMPAAAHHTTGLHQMICIASHRITSHHITSHHITSHHITSHLFAPCKQQLPTYFRWCTSHIQCSHAARSCTLPSLALPLQTTLKVKTRLSKKKKKKKKKIGVGWVRVNINAK